MMSNLTTIHERTASLPKQGGASANSPVVSGVKVLGIESKNGRKYPIEVMRKALEKYEGAIVNIDHPAGSEPRSYEDRFGRLTNARIEADGIYADLAYNPKHPLAEGFQWWVKNDPKAIGLSHNAQAKTKMNTEGVEEIEEIVKVDSVDLVAEPATTAGLMECVMKAKKIEEAMKNKENVEEAKEPRKMSLSELRSAKNKLDAKSSQLGDKIIAKGWGNFTWSELISKHGNDPDVSTQKKLYDELKEIRYQIDRREKGYKPEKEGVSFSSPDSKGGSKKETTKGFKKWNRMNVKEGDLENLGFEKRWMKQIDDSDDLLYKVLDTLKSALRSHTYSKYVHNNFYTDLKNCISKVDSAHRELDLFIGRGLDGTYSVEPKEESKPKKKAECNRS